MQKLLSLHIVVHTKLVLDGIRNEIFEQLQKNSLENTNKRLGVMIYFVSIKFSTFSNLYITRKKDRQKFQPCKILGNTKMFKNAKGNWGPIPSRQGLIASIVQIEFHQLCFESIESY